MTIFVTPHAQERMAERGIRLPSPQRDICCLWDKKQGYILLEPDGALIIRRTGPDSCKAITAVICFYPKAKRYETEFLKIQKTVLWEKKQDELLFTDRCL